MGFKKESTDVKTAQTRVLWDPWFTDEDRYQNDLKQFQMYHSGEYWMNEDPGWKQNPISFVWQFQSPFKEVYPDLYCAKIPQVSQIKPGVSEHRDPSLSESGEAFDP